MSSEQAGIGIISPVERAIVSALVPVILTKPSHKTLHPYFDRRDRPIAHVPHQVVDVCKRLRNVPQLQRQKIPLGLAAEAILEHLDVVHERHQLIVADVIHAKRRVFEDGSGELLFHFGSGWCGHRARGRPGVSHRVVQFRTAGAEHRPSQWPPGSRPPKGGCGLRSSSGTFIAGRS